MILYFYQVFLYLSFKQKGSVNPTIVREHIRRSFFVNYVHVLISTLEKVVRLDVERKWRVIMHHLWKDVGRYT